MTCPRCHGSGYFSLCPDDLCHGEETCIHGDDATCPTCQGEGEVAGDGYDDYDDYEGPCADD